MTIRDTTSCIVETKGNYIYSFYNNLGDAIEKLHELEKKEPGIYEITNYLTFTIRERRKWLTGIITEIDEDKFWYALEVLPPLKWHDNGVLETFCMSEFMTGPYTEQYASFNGKYYVKMVDYFDSSTHIMIEQLQKMQEKTA